MDLNESEPVNTGPEEHVLDPNEPYPVVIKPLHFILLCGATMGIYTIWWQYKCWKYFKEKEQDDTLPAVRSLLFLFFGIRLFDKIASYSRVYDYKVNYNPIVIWIACMMLNFTGYLPSPYFMLSALSFIPMVLPVQALNFYFTGNKNGYVGDKLNQRQIILIVIGAVLWASIIQAIITGTLPDPTLFK